MSRALVYSFVFIILCVLYMEDESSESGSGPKACNMSEHNAFDRKNLIISPLPSEILHGIMRIHLQHPGQPWLDFSDIMLPSKIVWPSGTPVLVPGVGGDEFDNLLPKWLLRWPVWLYQRKDENAPLFCPRFGNEGGLFLKFIVDFYDNLPERVAFIQGRPEIFNHGWEDMLRCLRPEVNFTTLAPQ